jgi:hypothetical protein
MVLGFDVDDGDCNHCGALKGTSCKEGCPEGIGDPADAASYSLGYREGYKEGFSDGQCVETCGNLLREMVEICLHLFRSGKLDADRSAKEMDLSSLLAGAQSMVPCENCLKREEDLAKWAKEHG